MRNSILLLVISALLGCSSDYKMAQSDFSDAGTKRDVQNINKQRGRSSRQIQSGPDPVWPEETDSVDTGPTPDAGLADASDAAPLSDAAPPPAEAVCGDGYVSETETCDTAIPYNEPGACPPGCFTQKTCMYAVVTGSDCQRHCVERYVENPSNGDGCCPAGYGYAYDSDCKGVCSDVTECSSGDGCCPTGCSRDQDKDCPEPETCDNGEIDEGETCDNGRWTPIPCRTECDKGKRLLGDPEQCTSYCVLQ